MSEFPLLSVRDVTKRYGAHIGCQDVTFDLYPGEVVGIVGESGSGKSTLLDCMAGHVVPDAGEVIFDMAVDGPRDTLAMPEPERRMLARTDWAFVHQHARDGLRMGVSAGGNVGERLTAVGARHYGDIRGTAVDWLERVEIDQSRIDDRPTTFSGGMQQRVNIARGFRMISPRCYWTSRQRALMRRTAMWFWGLLRMQKRAGPRLSGFSMMRPRVPACVTG